MGKPNTNGKREKYKQIGGPLSFKQGQTLGNKGRAIDQPICLKCGHKIDYEPHRKFWFHTNVPDDHEVVL